MTPEETLHAVRTIEVKLPTQAQVETFLRASRYKPMRYLSSGYVVWAPGPHVKARDTITLTDKRKGSGIFNFSLLAQAIERQYYQGHDENRCAQIIALIAEIEVDSEHDKL